MKKVELKRFENITLDKMSGIRLMRRIDKKFVFHAGSLQKILSSLEQDYFVQEIDGKNIFCYSTIYYDTPDYKMYCAHQNGKLNRLKVRTREYVDSSLCFLEVKKKSNKGLTQKIRIANRQPDKIADNEAAFLSSHIPYNPDDLESKLCSKYDRITLVNKAKTERVTIDLNLCFLNAKTKHQVSLPEMAIIEIKKEQASFSPIMNSLNRLRIKPRGMSKYCIGVALTENDPVVKVNNFKSKLNYLHKITSIKHE